jgi:hypothetical protein
VPHRAALAVRSYYNYFGHLGDPFQESGEPRSVDTVVIGKENPH